MCVPGKRQVPSSTLAGVRVPGGAAWPPSLVPPPGGRPTGTPGSEGSGSGDSLPSEMLGIWQLGPCCHGLAGPPLWAGQTYLEPHREPHLSLQGKRKCHAPQLSNRGTKI